MDFIQDTYQALGPLAALAIGTGGGLLGSVIDNVFRRKGQKDANRANRNLADRQAQHNVDFWNAQNSYNHPQQQMARLADAGLSPNLIYGSQNPVGTAGDIKGYDRAEAKNVNEGFNTFSNFYTLRNLDAQTNNIQQQEKVAQQEEVKKAYEGVGIALDNRRKSFDLGLSKALLDTSIQTAVANSETAVANARRASSEADVSIGTKDARIRRATIQANLASSQLKGQDLINKLRDIQATLDEQLKPYGMTSSDNVFLRILASNVRLRPFLEFFMGGGDFRNLKDVFK